MTVLKLYTKADCPGCQKVKRMLNFLQVAFEERKVDEVSDYLERIMALGFRSVPIVEVEGFGAVPAMDTLKLEHLLVAAQLM
jgi:glutaredoxin